MVKTDRSQKFNEQDYIRRLKEREELIKKIENFLNDKKIKESDEVKENTS